MCLYMFDRERVHGFSAIMLSMHMPCLICHDSTGIDALPLDAAVISTLSETADAQKDHEQKLMLCEQ